MSQRMSAQSAPLGAVFLLMKVFIVSTAFTELMRFESADAVVDVL
jgi:hypothetical protein